MGRGGRGGGGGLSGERWGRGCKGWGKEEGDELISLCAGSTNYWSHLSKPAGWRHVTCVAASARQQI